MSYVYEVKNVLPPEYCKHLIDKFEKSDDKGPGYCGNTDITNKSVKISTDLNLCDNPSFYDEVNYISKCLNSHISAFFKNFDKNIKNFNGCTAKTLYKPHTPWMQIQRTKKGQYFDWHFDYRDRGEDRRLAFILYLNTLDENDGGETEFMDGKIIRPEVSKLIIFPSTWTNYHRGCTVLGKTKYILTGFVCSTIHPRDYGEYLYDVLKNKLKK